MGRPSGFLEKNFRNSISRCFIEIIVRVTDELNICAMDEFQIKSWKTRQLSHLYYYKIFYPLAMEQGDLKNPLYFDHISFSQYSTLNAILN